MSLGVLGLDPGPGTARDWMRSELAGREYQPSLTERFFGWVRRLLDQVQDAVSERTGFSPLVAAAVLVAIALVLALLLSRLRTDRGRAEQPQALFTDVRRSAADHRTAARAALERGQWDQSVLESVRAWATDLIERGLVVEDPGATAHEIAASAAERFPGLAERLWQAVRVFDGTRYGGRRAEERDARAAYALQEEVRTATPGAASERGPLPALPR